MDREPHKELFSGYSLKLGKTFWYILKAANEMDRRRYRTLADGAFEQTVTTDFGKEVGSDEMHWWIFKKEDKIDELQKRTKQALPFVQKLKENSKKLITNPPSKYDELVSTLKEFAESHGSEIDVLYEYVAWLHKRNILAPCILYTYRVWGATRRSDRWVGIEAENLDTEDPSIIERLTAIVFGLARRGRYTLNSVYYEVSHEIYDSLDPEYSGPVSIPMNRVLIQTSYESLGEFATFFEFIRNSLRNILLDIEKCEEQKVLMKSESFWNAFIEKARHARKAEPQLWDFKKTLNMWHVKKPDVKAEKELDFCEAIASLANAEGGVLIIGISDTSPREILGIGEDTVEIERRLKYTRKVIANYIKYDRDIVYFQQVSLKDKSGNERICLVIVIAQAEEVVSVKDKKGKFSYPVRRATGLDRIDRDEIAIKKLHIKNDNYDFIKELYQFTYDK